MSQKELGSRKVKDNIKQSAKQIIKAENNGDEMRQAEQVCT